MQQTNWNKTRNTVAVIATLLSLSPLCSVAMQKDSYQEYNQGVTYAKNGQWSQAADSFRQSINENPNFSPAYYNLGVAYENLGRYEEAIVDYTQAKKLAPLEPLSYNALGELYSQKKEWAQAIQEYKQSLILDPNNARTHEMLGYAYLANGQKVLASSEQQTLASLNPTAAERLKQSLDSNKLTENYEPRQSKAPLANKGKQHGDSSTKEESNSQAILKELRPIQTLFNNKEWEKAEQLLTEIAAKYPKSEWPHVYLAFLYKEQNALDVAFKEAQIAYKLSPDNPSCQAAVDAIQKAQKQLQDDPVDEETSSYASEASIDKGDVNRSSYAAPLQDSGSSILNIAKEGHKMDSQSGVIFIFIISIVLGTIGLMLYFLPTILAVCFQNTNWIAIALINLFLGWSGLGWIAALIMAIWKKDTHSNPVVYVDNHMTTPSTISELRKPETNE